MAAVAVDADNTRLDDADATTNWTKLTQATSQEPDFKYQGSYSVSGKIGTASAGHYLSGGTSMPINMTTAGQEVVVMKAIWTNKDVLQSVPAAEHRVGSGTGAYYSYYIADDGTQGDIDYPAKGGWLINPIDPNVTAWYDGTTGSPSKTAIDYIATLGRFTGTSKSENVATDAVDVGNGLNLVGGDGANADGTFQDFIDDDEGDITNGRYGFVSTNEGVINTYGRLVIGHTAATPGTPVATVFTDSLATLVFPGGRVDAGWNALEFDCGSATTVISLTNISIIGRGRDNLKRWFDSANEVDGANEELDITAHGFLTGDAVLYSDEGGTAVTGLTDATEYFVEVITADSISLHTSRQNAYTSATPIGLTAAGTSQQHSLRRQPDTRPDLDVTGTSGSATLLGCVLQAMRELTSTSALTYDTCTIVGCTKIDLTDTDLTDCNISEQVTTEGEALVVTNTLENITGCTFEQGDYGGHAIEVDDNTDVSQELLNVTLTGYGATHKEFNALNDVDDANDEVDITGHGFTTGDPFYYSDEGGTAITGLTDQTRYYLRAVTVDAISFHRTKYDAVNNSGKIAISAGSDEEHALYSADAAIYNNTGGALTIEVNGSTVPTIRNSAGSSTTLTNSKTVTITVIDAETTTAIVGARVFMEAAAGTGLPSYASVSITASGTLATVTHASHGMKTGQKVAIRGANEQDYNGVFTITVTGANNYTYTMSGSPTSPATGTITATGVIINEVTIAGGVASEGFDYTGTDQPIQGWVREATAPSPIYKEGIIAGSIESNGYSATIALFSDE